MAKKILSGVVVSIKPSKTVVVSVDLPYMHDKYKKRVMSSKKYSAHGEGVNVGQAVSIVESRPISKSKKWVLLSL